MMKRDIALDSSLNISNVNKAFNGVAALTAINLSIARGAFVSLLGPSGCGKSSLLNLIAGFLQPDSGTIAIDGKDIGRIPPQQRNLGFLFQDYALFPHLSVAENIAYPLIARKESREAIRRKVAAVLERIDLRTLADRYPDTLSGGQRQRVALARATVFTPPVLLLDEPLGALDRRMRDAMQVQFKRWHKELGTTFVYVTHDQDEALSMSDVIVMMNHGRIEQVGTPEEVYRHPNTEFVASFLGDCNLLAPGLLRTFVKAANTDMLDGAWAHALQHEHHLLAVRPEHINVSAHPSADVGAASVPARIVQARFYGTHSILDLDTSAGAMSVRLHTPISDLASDGPVYAIINVADIAVINK